MKISALFAVIAAAVAVSADDAPPATTAPACVPDPDHPFPKCAATCMMEAVKAVGCTNMTDYLCQCKNFDKLHTSAGPCIEKDCGAAAAEVGAAAEALCSACMPGMKGKGMGKKRMSKRLW